MVTIKIRPKPDLRLVAAGMSFISTTQEALNIQQRQQIPFGTNLNLLHPNNNKYSFGKKCGKNNLLEKNK